RPSSSGTTSIGSSCAGKATIVQRLIAFNTNSINSVCQRYMDDDEVTFEEVIATRGVNVAALEIEVLPSKWDLVDPQELRQLMALVREMRVRRSMIRLNKQYVQVTKGLFLGSK